MIGFVHPSVLTAEAVAGALAHKYRHLAVVRNYQSPSSPAMLYVCCPIGVADPCNAGCVAFSQVIADARASRRVTLSIMDGEPVHHTQKKEEIEHGH